MVAEEITTEQKRTRKPFNKRKVDGNFECKQIFQFFVSDFVRVCEGRGKSLYHTILMLNIFTLI